MSAVGEAHPRAVLSDHDVELLLELRGEGFSLAWLANKFEVSKTQASRIVRGVQRIDVGLARAALPVRRVCRHPLPSLPALIEGQAVGDRVMALVTYVLAPTK